MDEAERERRKRERQRRQREERERRLQEDYRRELEADLERQRAERAARGLPPTIVSPEPYIIWARVIRAATRRVEAQDAAERERRRWRRSRKRTQREEPAD